jgi:hypothetical protein
MRHVLLAGIVGALLLPAPAHAGQTVPRGFVGVMADGPLFSPNVELGREVDLMAAAGVEAVRVAVYWADAQPYPPGTPLPPGYVDVDGVPTSFAGPDAVVAEAARRHLGVLPVVLLAPIWARENPFQTWSPPAPGAYSRYASFMAALVQRYKEGGTFWAHRRGLPQAPIHAWQLWNEPNGPRFWTLQPGLASYARLVRVTRAAIKRADLRSEVVLGGLTDRSWEDLRRLYRLGIRGSVDAVALNPFSAKVRNVVRIVRRARKVMRLNGDARKPLLVTETSWPSGRDRLAKRFGYEQTERGQARKLRKALLALARERRRLRIRQVFWYTWMSYDKNLYYGFDWAGVRRLEGSTITTKPAYHALRRVARRLEGCGKRPVAARCRR